MFTDKVGKTKITLVKGDITEQNTEAIVNAANSSLMGGGGVDGAIHNAGGSDILKECKEIRKKQGKLPSGEAVITTGGKLEADYVIHTVGPIWKGGDNKEDETLANAYINSLKVAIGNRITSVAFPSISTGAYRFPVERAAKIALTTLKEFVEQSQGLLIEVRMVLHSQKDYDIYLKKWENLR